MRGFERASLDCRDVELVLEDAGVEGGVGFGGETSEEAVAGEEQGEEGGGGPERSKGCQLERDSV